MKLFVESQSNDFDDSDNFPLSSYEDGSLDLSSTSINRSFYGDLPSTLNQTSKSVSSLSSPFHYLVTILVFYLLLTVVLLSFSLYKQRQTEIENFYFGDTEEEIEQGKRSLILKKFLIDKIDKGDVKPLLSEHNDKDLSTNKYPLNVV